MNKSAYRKYRRLIWSGIALAILTIWALLPVQQHLLEALSPHGSQFSPSQHDMATIKTQLDAFQIQNDRFPTTNEGLDALVKNPGNMPNWTRYLDKIPLDPWGHPYVYRCPGTNGRDYDLFCTGPDGKIGGGDDYGDVGSP